MTMERPELRKRPANFVALSPVSFLKRAAEFFGDRTAIVHGGRRFTYREFYARARRLAHALTKAGIRRGDTVAILAANIPAMLEAHYAAPMIGAILNPINVRLDAPLIAFCLEHGEADHVADLGPRRDGRPVLGNAPGFTARTTKDIDGPGRRAFEKCGRGGHAGSCERVR